MAKRLIDSSVYKNLIASDKLEAKLRQIDFSKVNETKSMVSSEVNTIDTRIKYPTKNRIIELYNNNKIIIINDKEIGIPSYLSTLVMQSSTKEFKILSDISKLTTKSKNISVSTLFGVLQNAMIAYELNYDWDKYTSNPQLMISSAIIYSSLNLKIIDKLNSINSNSIESDFLAFLFAKFFLINMVGRVESAVTDSIAHSACFNDTTLKILQDKEKNLNLNGELYKDIIHLIQSISSLPEHKIKFRTFFENYIRMFGDSTVLAIDYLPAFYQMIFSVAVASNLNKEFAIEKTVSRQLITKCYSEFSRLI